MRKVLVLQHVPYEGQGYIADYMQEHGLDFDVVRLWETYVVPDVSQYSALIVMGGPMGVHEDYPAKHDEIAIIKAAIGTIPMLGICLGSQLIAHALGARVYANEHDGKPAKEIGYYTVHLTPEGAANRLFFSSTWSSHRRWSGDLQRSIANGRTRTSIWMKSSSIGTRGLSRHS